MLGSAPLPLPPNLSHSSTWEANHRFRRTARQRQPEPSAEMGGWARRRRTLITCPATLLCSYGSRVSWPSCFSPKLNNLFPWLRLFVWIWCWRPQTLLLLVQYFHFVPGDFYTCVYRTLHCWGPVGHDVHAERGCHSAECINTCYLNLANKGKSEQIAIGCSTIACSRCFDFFSSTHKQLENSFRHLPLHLYLSCSACCRAE